MDRRVGNLVILFMGKKRSGKNTAAQVIKQQIQKNIGVSVGTDGKMSRGCLVQEFAFANELRMQLNILNPIVSLCGNYRWNDALDKYGYETAKDKFPEMRRLMEKYGTEVIRSRVEENYWANFVRRDVERFNLISREHRFDTVSLITDCRFPNEIKAFGDSEYPTGTVEILGVQRDEVDDGSTHPSNAGLNAIPENLDELGIGCLSVLSNNGTLEEFESSVKHLWKEIKRRKEVLDGDGFGY